MSDNLNNECISIKVSYNSLYSNNFEIIFNHYAMSDKQSNHLSLTAKSCKFFNEKLNVKFNNLTNAHILSILDKLYSLNDGIDIVLNLLDTSGNVCDSIHHMYIIESLSTYLDAAENNILVSDVLFSCKI